MIKGKQTAGLALLAASILLTGCQTNRGLYHWGTYESGLYSYYEDPAGLAALSEQLLKSIEEANGRVPPGMYAEYGTLLLQQGKREESIIYYTKEKELWPESQHLMNVMIKNLTHSPGANGQGES